MPKEQQLQHIHEIVSYRRTKQNNNEKLWTDDLLQRDQAWDIRAYPCTGLGSWLTPQLCRLPVYDSILKRVKNGGVLMDVGTFVGHDLRRLVYDGAPSDKLYGVDIVNHFDVGYNLFRDRDRFKGKFIEADLLSTTSPDLLVLKGQVDIILVSQVLHQWNWDGQLKAAQALSTFTKPGSWIVGNQIGNPEAQEIVLKAIPLPLYRHNVDSIERMFEALGEATGTRWETQAWMRTFEDMGWDPKDGAWMEPNVGIVEFVVKRLS